MSAGPKSDDLNPEIQEIKPAQPTSLKKKQKQKKNKTESPPTKKYPKSKKRLITITIINNKTDTHVSDTFTTRKKMAESKEILSGHLNASIEKEKA